MTPAAELGRTRVATIVVVALLVVASTVEEGCVSRVGPGIVLAAVDASKSDGERLEYVNSRSMSSHMDELTIPAASSMTEASASMMDIIRPGIFSIHIATTPMKATNRPNAPAKAEYELVAGVWP